jgi:hypothetical protein
LRSALSSRSGHENECETVQQHNQNTQKVPGTEKPILTLSASKRKIKPRKMAMTMMMKSTYVGGFVSSPSQNEPRSAPAASAHNHETSREQPSTLREPVGWSNKNRPKM